MLRVIGHKIEGNALFVTVQGASVTEVTSADARKVAYEERHKHGFSNAGISNSGGPYPVNTQKDNTVVPSEEMRNVQPAALEYQVQFKLVPSL